MQVRSSLSSLKFLGVIHHLQQAMRIRPHNNISTKHISITFRRTRTTIVFRQARTISARLNTDKGVFSITFRFTHTRRRARLRHVPTDTHITANMNNSTLHRRLSTSPNQRATVNTIRRTTKFSNRTHIGLLIVRQRSLLSRSRITDIERRFNRQPIGRKTSPVVELALLPPGTGRLLVE